MIITYRNPKNFDKTVDVYFNIEQNEFTDRWKQELKDLLVQNYHLEKNYCFMGFVFESNPRNVDFLCNEVNIAIEQINKFNKEGIWQKQGLKSYNIKDHFNRDTVMHDENLPIGDATGDPWLMPGCMLKHDAMNQLHRYFEDLQGEAWGLSEYYKLADFETKYAIRQLNVLCHEIESWVNNYRKYKYQPQYTYPSQITTWLQAPRKHLTDQDYELFKVNGFDREFGGVYLHWAQVGKTHIEVFRDEEGADVDDAVCSAISALKYYTGEFDIGWNADVTYNNAPWHREEQDQFYTWLKRNGFDPNDPKLSLGYIKLGHCDFIKSFGTNDKYKVWEILSEHLDIYKVSIDGVSNTFDYVWSQPDYKQKQIDFMKPGYIWSSVNDTDN